jgi:hypothetical protein
MDILNKNDMFKARMNDFPASEFAKHTGCCGHYGRIVEAFVRFSRGQFLKTIPSLRKFLISNLTNTGIRELFIVLCTDFSAAFEVNRELFIEATSNVSPESSFYTITAIDQATRKKDEAAKICNVDFISNLIRIGKSEEHRPISRIEAYMLAERLIHSKIEMPKEELESLLKAESENYDFAGIENVAILAASLRVLRTKDERVLLRILDESSSTFLRDGIISSLQNLSEEEIKDFVTKTSFVEKLMEAFKNTTGNVHLSQVIHILQSKNVEEGNEEFEKFVAEEVEPRNEKREAGFGGDRPHIYTTYSDEDSEVGGTQPADDDIDNELFSNLSSSSDSDDSDDNNGGLSFSNSYNKDTMDSDSDSDDSDDDAKTNSFNNRRFDINISSDSDDSSDDDGFKFGKSGLPPVPSSTTFGIPTLPPIAPFGGDEITGKPFSLNESPNDFIDKKTTAPELNFVLPPLDKVAGATELPPIPSHNSDDELNSPINQIIPPFPGSIDSSDKILLPPLPNSESKEDSIPTSGIVLPPFPLMTDSETTQFIPPPPPLNLPEQTNTADEKHEEGTVDDS